MLSDIYNKRILELAANLPRIGRLEAPDGSATAHSKLCGSTVTVDVALGPDGRVADFAHDVKACALGQASSAIMAGQVIGADAADLRGLRDAMRAMLKQNAAPPAGRWAECAVLEPVRDYKARHASTLLTFDATLEAVEKALAARMPAPLPAAG
ncbi:iron-sulfur cluster assembly scaffold protein [Lichenibacterium ramalinae]|uniref:Iron-sulfur cluster assembly scaffold protein n=1 Tax=Lichenibacterium ramalinae TaxID=2316527 RepID=A0A4Q2R736_9HYPH|nr:iron-sulfur cluster assembly scaffold protein [Lichenibacterium ramalinae]RYB02452.1 iron-sulfur cluster assembly scaffold protein [Lichenibacterium ramalinae]